MVQKFYDDLAYGMDKVLSDENYQQIFAKPKIKTASAQPQPEPEKIKLSTDGISDTFNTLVALSGMLDDMGFSKSSIQLLKAAQEIRDEVKIDEFEPEDKEVAEWLKSTDEPGPSDDEDMDALLAELGSGGGAWDVGNVMDKPDDEDHEEGNPEC
jgi:hypothetical protein